MSDILPASRYAFVGYCTVDEDRIAFAVTAPTQEAAKDWLFETYSDSLKTTVLSITAEAIHRGMAVQWLRDNAAHGIEVMGNFPKAQAVADAQEEHRMEKFFRDLAGDPVAHRQWCELERSLAPADDRMWVISCVMHEGPMVVSVERARDVKQATEEGRRGVRYSCDASPKIVRAHEVGFVSNPTTDTKALAILRDAAARGCRLIGFLQVIGGHVLIDVASAEKSGGDAPKGNVA